MGHRAAGLSHADNSAVNELMKAPSWIKKSSNLRSAVVLEALKHSYDATIVNVRRLVYSRVEGKWVLGIVHKYDSFDTYNAYRNHKRRC